MSELYTHLQNNSGFTVSKELKHFNGLGFAVSLKSNTVIIDSELLNESLFNAIVQNLQITIKENEFIGAWLDSQTFKIHFDINTIHTDLDSAIKTAKENEQIAIYNLGTQREIRLIT